MKKVVNLFWVWYANLNWFKKLIVGLIICTPLLVGLNAEALHWIVRLLLILITVLLILTELWYSKADLNGSTSR